MKFTHEYLTESFKLEKKQKKKQIEYRLEFISYFFNLNNL